jgi:hypothetical protein
VRTASLLAGLPADTPAAAEADEAEALAAAIAEGCADTISSPFEFIEDLRNKSFDQRLASITGRAPSGLAGRSFTRQASSKLPLGLDPQASAALAANLQAALHLAGVESCLEMRGGGSFSAAGGSGSVKSRLGEGAGSGSQGAASLVRALSALGSVAECDAETMEALIDEALVA